MILEILYEHNFHTAKYDSTINTILYRDCRININGEDVYNYCSYSFNNISLQNHLIPENPIVHIIPDTVENVGSSYKNNPSIMDIIHSISNKFHINEIEIIIKYSGIANKSLIIMNVSELQTNKQIINIINTSQFQDKFHNKLSNSFHIFRTNMVRPLEHSIIVEIICKSKPISIPISIPKLDVKMDNVGVTNIVIPIDQRLKVAVSKKNKRFSYK